MTKPTTVKGTKVRLLQGDGATPTEAFTAFCGLTARSISFQTNTNDTQVPDCDDPDAPQWREITKVSRFVSVSGSGILDMNALPEYQAAYDDPDSVNYRIEIAVPMASNGGYWEGAFMLTGFTITGNDGEFAQVELSIESDGPVTWVDATV
jgi:predicted secreted protein